MASTNMTFKAHLSCKTSCFYLWLTCTLTNCTVKLNRHVLYIEVMPFPKKCFTQGLLHCVFQRSHYSCDIDRNKGNHHARFENASLHQANKDSSNTTNFIDKLEGKCKTWSVGKLVLGCNLQLLTCDFMDSAIFQLTFHL